MASISLKSVSKVYSGKKEQVEAARDFSLEIGDREFVVLVNGGAYKGCSNGDYGCCPTPDRHEA